MNAFVVSGLVKRRAELAGEIERTHEALHKMVLDLENLDATILQFERISGSKRSSPRRSGHRRIGATGAK
jgi:hypothetical protein